MVIDPSFLQILWFLLIAVLWAGYLVLEGFDFGVGMLFSFLPKGEKEKRVMVNTIGPVWDGNEVWLLTAGGATFAAFPEWYATLFSGFYLPLLVILLALIARGVAFEYRGKMDSDRWRKIWDWCIMLGSWIPAVLWGVAFGNIVRGIDIIVTPSPNGLGVIHEVGTGFFGLLNPFALLGGATTTLVFLLHGAIFVALKTAGDIQQRSAKLAKRLSIPATVVAAAWVLWMVFAFSHETKIIAWVGVVVAALALVGVIFTTYKERHGWAFLFSAVAILGAVVVIFGSLYPYVMPATNGMENALDITNASSTENTLTVMSWVAVCLVPIVLAYQAWSYWVFRKRLTTKTIPEPTGPESPVVVTQL